MKQGREVTVECEKCDEVFIVAADDTSIIKSLFGHEIECPKCGAWCEFELEDDTFEKDD